MTSHSSTITLLSNLPKQFALVSELKESRLLADSGPGILEFEFKGYVDLETMKWLTKKGIGKIREEGYSKIVLNNASSPVFADEANDWIKDFLLTNRHRFHFKITRVAVISSDSYKINLYAHFMKTAFQVIFPGVQLASFEFEESAIDWMI